MFEAKSARNFGSRASFDALVIDELIAAAIDNTCARVLRVVVSNLINPIGRNLWPPTHAHIVIIFAARAARLFPPTESINTCHFRHTLTAHGAVIHVCVWTLKYQTDRHSFFYTHIPRHWFIYRLSFSRVNTLVTRVVQNFVNSI